MQYWFLAPSLEDAAQNDLKLFTSIQKFKKVPGKLSKEKEVIAAKIGRLPAQPLPIKKPNLPKVSEKSSLGDLVPHLPIQR